jgi:hypothetical protein
MKKISVLWLAWMFLQLCAVGLAQEVSRAEFTSALARVEKDHDELNKVANENRTEIARLKAQSEVWATILSVVSGGTAVLGGVNQAMHRKTAAAKPTRGKQ